ncbi:MAG: ATP-binding protein [Candidatus Omnitrophica bacterium]|nr:ATP-binding protein [Candidatus Omnitrophota bacterium]
MTFHRKISSELKNVPKVINWIIEKIKKLKLEEDDIFDIRISLEEAIVNAIKHGNKLNPKLSVDIFLKIIDKSLIIEIKDEGEGFDINNLPDPTSFDNLEKLSGRGLFLIKNLMDEVELLERGRKIRMIKFFKSGGKDECKRRKNK